MNNESYQKKLEKFLLKQEERKLKKKNKKKKKKKTSKKEVGDVSVTSSLPVKKKVGRPKKEVQRRNAYVVKLNRKLNKVLFLILRSYQY